MYYRGIPNKYPPLNKWPEQIRRAQRENFGFLSILEGGTCTLMKLPDQINDRDQIGVSKISLINDRTQIAQILDH